MVMPVASGHAVRHMVESYFEHKSDSRAQIHNYWVILSPGVQGKEASRPYLQHGKGLRREKAEKTSHGLRLLEDHVERHVDNHMAEKASFIPE